MPSEQKLPFEKPLSDLRDKIATLKKLAENNGMDFTEEILRLEEKCKQMEEELYSEMTAAQKMHVARHQQRPTSLDFIQAIFTDFMELHGDRLFADDLAIVGGLAKFNGLPVTVVGHQRGKDTRDNIARFFGSPHPEGFRKALRLMQQANKFNRPIITFIDTKGAYPGNTAEERGQSEAIARNLREMAGFGVPIICVVIGEGGSGGALALGVGNRVIMLENAIYSAISPNGAASILWKDASKADVAAEAMKITAKDLLQFEIIEDIVAEPQGGAHRDLAFTADQLKEKLWHHLQELLQLTPEELIEDRYQKFRKIGEFRIAEPAEQAPAAAELQQENAPSAEGEEEPASGIEAESAQV
ncbi:acetyl-CoA carboxylase carboxyltransferase subunit alpha [Paenibacillus radicis (ex Gao et al. 2016)]|uniref:Acetyl-coenzyme A carboxylase carboxyl transferase subunit alpha n=1 Tax=Paenibacillus radicis (ex Gao et al. 2016) TaxID=1737354 RepID=A0A917M4D2_9BACL|nr:acetyl-CoA carboxylase carboxyltransferase subunit alpha [Paenibacillus radicis (ex Gao et al. 2016)]GGG74732.1 acetyl-coenzyme A carboxylase carboxyl transferase subunit alpha [Paenibacillus radicis (ex Gao et al. 2016)]